MILTDREIQIALQTGVLKIEPRPKPDAISSTSVDLTLGDKFAVWRALPGMTISPGADGFDYAGSVALQEMQTGNHVLKPQSFVIASTMERVTISREARLVARVEGSWMARMGIGIHVTAPTVHSGFEGKIQLEIFNFGPNLVKLESGMRICQLIFEQTFGMPDKPEEEIEVTSTRILPRLKEATGITDDVLGEMLGKSRPTIQAYTSGRLRERLSSEACDKLIEFCDSRISALNNLVTDLKNMREDA